MSGRVPESDADYLLVLARTMARDGRTGIGIRLARIAERIEEAEKSALAAAFAEATDV